MSYEILNLKAAAAHLHMDERELLHAAQRDEVHATRRGDDWVFEHRLLDEWAQRRVLGLSRKELKTVHATETQAAKRSGNADLVIAELLQRSGIAPDLTSKTRGGVLRDMADLAERTGFVYDPEAYYHEVVAREEAASTAMGGGVAFLHARYHDPYIASDSFIVLGRTRNPVFFGSPDDEPTDIFFLIYCTSHERHLHALARLAMMSNATEMLANIRAADSADAIQAAVLAAEQELVAPL